MRLTLFGEWLPNTYYAKRGHGTAFYLGGARYVLDFLREYSALLLVPAVAVALIRRGKSASKVPTLCMFFSRF